MAASIRRPYMLGAITAFPLLAIALGFSTLVLFSIFDPSPAISPPQAAHVSMDAGGLEFHLGSTSNTTGIVMGAGLLILAVALHTIMMFYYLIKMQSVKAVDQNFMLLWLLVFMTPGGQLVFWYLYLWKPTAMEIPAVG